MQGCGTCILGDIAYTGLGRENSDFENTKLSGGIIQIYASQTIVNSQLLVNGLRTFTVGMAGSGGSGASVTGVPLPQPEKLRATGSNYQFILIPV